MSQPTPDPDSPFASFAQPKKSVVDEVKERAEEQRQSSKVRWLILGLALGGSVAGVTLGIAVGMGPGHAPLALAYGLGGALLGIPVGWTMGMLTWALVSFSSKAPSGLRPIGAGMVAGNQWSRMAVWLTVWAAVGMVMGAAGGAALATGPESYAAAEPALGWGMSGGCLGMVVTIGGWLLRKRFGKAAATPADP